LQNKLESGEKQMLNQQLRQVERMAEQKVVAYMEKINKAQRNAE